MMNGGDFDNDIRKYRAKISEVLKTSEIWFGIDN